MVNDPQNDYSCAVSGNQIDNNMKSGDQAPVSRVFSTWVGSGAQKCPYFPVADKNGYLRDKAVHFVDIYWLIHR
jgi:hypothetical protein